MTVCRTPLSPGYAPGAVFVIALIVSSVAFSSHAQEQLDPSGTPNIDLRITLGVDPLDPPVGYEPCGTSTALHAYTGENVRWCFRIINNTDFTLSRHDLQTSRFGTLFTNFPFQLASGATAFVTQVEPVSTTLQGSATWRAYEPGTALDYSDTATARVIVRSGIDVVVTASIDPLVVPPNYDECGSQTVVPATPGRTVRWCYTVKNRSSIARTRHTVNSSQAGSLLADFPYNLSAGGEAFLTRTQPMASAAIEETATWTAYRPGPLHVSTASATARVLALNDGIFANGFD